jgi:hypothetical protein
MTPEQLAIFKETVTAAVDKHLANGGILSVGTFGSGDCRCPISCLMVEDRPKDDSSGALVGFLSKKMGFGLSDEQIWSFINGFDGSRWGGDSAMRRLGQEFRNKYRPG